MCPRFKKDIFSASSLFFNKQEEVEKEIVFSEKSTSGGITSNGTTSNGTTMNGVFNNQARSRAKNSERSCGYHQGLRKR